MQLFVTVPNLKYDDCLTGSWLDHDCSSILNQASIFQLFSSVQAVRLKYVLFCRHVVSIWRDWRRAICQNCLVFFHMYITLKFLTFIPFTDIRLQKLLTPWSWILTKELRDRQLVKKFSTFYGALSFIKFLIRTWPLCHFATLPEESVKKYYIRRTQPLISLLYSNVATCFVR
jgi:hypothetical protein